MEQLKEFSKDEEVVEYKTVGQFSGLGLPPANPMDYFPKQEERNYISVSQDALPGESIAEVADRHLTPAPEEIEPPHGLNPESRRMITECFAELKAATIPEIEEALREIALLPPEERQESSDFASYLERRLQQEEQAKHVAAVIDAYSSEWVGEEPFPRAVLDAYEVFQHGGEWVDCVHAVVTEIEPESTLDLLIDAYDIYEEACAWIKRMPMTLTNWLEVDQPTREGLYVEAEQILTDKDCTTAPEPEEHTAINAERAEELEIIASYYKFMDEWSQTEIEQYAAKNGITQEEINEMNRCLNDPVYTREKKLTAELAYWDALAAKEGEPTPEQIQEALEAQAEADAEEATSEQIQDNGVRIGSLLPYATYDEYLEASERANSCPLSEYSFREAKADTASGFATYEDYLTWAGEINAKCKCGKCEKISPISEKLFHESKELASELKDRCSFEETMMSVGITVGDNDAYMKWCEAKDVYQYDLETFQRWCELTEAPTNEQIEESRATHPYDEEDDFFELSKHSWCGRCVSYEEYLIWTKRLSIHPMSEESFRDYRANCVLQMNRRKDTVRVVYLVIKADGRKSWDEAYYNLFPATRHPNLQHDYPEVWEHYANGKELDPDVWASCGEQRTRVLWEFSAADPLGFSQSDADLDRAELVRSGASSTADDDDDDWFAKLARQA